MHAALWLPRFPLQAVLGAQPPRAETLLALLDESAEATRDKACVLHASAAAERCGVQPGMTASQAQARCPSLTFLPRDAAAEVAAQRALLDCAARWTPNYEATLPGFCVLDLQQHRRIAGQEEASGQHMHEQLRQQRFDARVGFAVNADLAMLAAQAAQPVLVLRDEQAATAFLHALPVQALRPTAEMLQVFALWGVRTLGDLIKLPRAELAARLGRAGVLLWDMAAGGRERLLRLVRPAASFREELELEHPIECLEPLLFVLRRMLQGLCDRLADVWLVAAAMLITLRFDDRQEHQRELHVAEPTRDVELLFRLLHTHLDGVSAAAPMVFVALEVRPARPAGNQSDLFERALRDPNRFAETLAQLAALLGHGRVGKVRLLPSRRTDAFTLVEFNEAMPATQGVTCTPAGLPLRRWRPAPAVRVQLCDGRPQAFQQGHQQHAITQAEGPWLLSGDWWDAATRWDKEVWTVQTDDGALYQLARQSDAWVVEGVLG